MTNQFGNKEIVLVLGGAFAPLHTQHVAAMNCAKKCAEEHGYTVIAGYLAVSTDGYVKNKLKTWWIKGICFYSFIRSL